MRVPAPGHVGSVSGFVVQTSSRTTILGSLAPGDATSSPGGVSVLPPPARLRVVELVYSCVLPSGAAGELCFTLPDGDVDRGDGAGVVACSAG